jgi:hypothetical protein
LWEGSLLSAFFNSVVCLEKQVFHTLGPLFFLLFMDIVSLLPDVL